MIGACLCKNASGKRRAANESRARGAAKNRWIEAPVRSGGFGGCCMEIRSARLHVPAAAAAAGPHQFMSLASRRLLMLLLFLAAATSAATRSGAIFASVAVAVAIAVVVVYYRARPQIASLAALRQPRPQTSSHVVVVSVGRLRACCSRGLSWAVSLRAAVCSLRPTQSFDLKWFGSSGTKRSDQRQRTGLSVCLFVCCLLGGRCNIGRPNKTTNQSLALIKYIYICAHNCNSYTLSLARSLYSSFRGPTRLPNGRRPAKQPASQSKGTKESAAIQMIRMIYESQDNY